MVKKYKIKFHEKKLGQLFCDNCAQEIIDMLLIECKLANVVIKIDIKIVEVKYKEKSFIVQDNLKTYTSSSLIIATGGLSIPKIGASKFGYEIAKQFNLNIIDPVPALVPLTFNQKILKKCKLLAGVSTNAIISIKKNFFEEGMLFTHRGLSGPSILQISSYWKEGDSIKIDLCPQKNIFNFLLEKRNTSPKQNLNTIINSFLAKRLATSICEENKITGNIGELSNKNIKKLADSINNWLVEPLGTEGYRTAEVTLGGVDTNELSSKTMMSKKYPGLFFIGEVVDVTGHLGGYNFQWAWSSGYVAGQYA